MDFISLFVAVLTIGLFPTSWHTKWLIYRPTADVASATIHMQYGGAHTVASGPLANSALVNHATVTVWAPPYCIWIVTHRHMASPGVRHGQSTTVARFLHNILKG